MTTRLATIPKVARARGVGARLLATKKDEERLRRVLPNLETMSRKEQLAALRSVLVDLIARANGLADVVIESERQREKVLSDYRLVLAEISARENGR